MIHTSLRRHQTGISMIESLVALFVLALGILGLAGLQTRTLTETRLTNARAVAVRMAGDIHERMKLNTGALNDSAANGTPNPYLVGWGAAPAGTNCNTAACTSAQLAGFDLAQWKATLAASLPGGNGAIYAMPGDPTAFGVVIAWTDNVSAQADGLADDDNPFLVTTDVANVTCQDGSICHLIRMRP